MGRKSFLLCLFFVLGKSTSYLAHPRVSLRSAVNSRVGRIFDEPSTKAQPHSVVFDKAPAEEMKKEKKVSKSAATFSPGKYVASARSNLYHEPKCEWAKKIKKDRRLWFTEKEEAWQKGFKAHNCS